MRITSVEAIPVRIPRDRERDVHTAGSPTGLREGQGAYRWSTVVSALYPVHFETALVKVQTDSGLTGWGEAQAPLAPEVACSIVNLLLRPAVRGVEFQGEIGEIESLWNRMYSTMRVRGQTGGFMLDAISGVDLALWDLAGQIQGLPVSALIAGGRARDSVPAYLSGVPGSGAAERLAEAVRFRDAGFREFKLFYDSGPDELFAFQDALREALGPDARIAVDALWRLTPETAPAFGRELDRRDALWFECPLPPEDARAHAELARRVRTPLALGESYRTCRELAPFFEGRCFGFAQPDLGRTGLTEGLRIARTAAARGVTVVPHVSIAMGPQIAAAVHFAAALPECPLLEYNPNVLAMANRFLGQPLRLAGAAYEVPRAPGLGAAVVEHDLRLAAGAPLEL